MRGTSNERSVLVAKQDVATTKNCSVTNYQGSDSRQLPFGLDKTQLSKACVPTIFQMLRQKKNQPNPINVKA